MIQYRAGKYGLLFACRLRGSVFPKAMMWAVPAAAVTALLHYQLSDADAAKTMGLGDITNVLGGFNFVLGFLIVFRSQQAYARWWEGGTLLHQLRGEWFNAFSSCVAFCNASPEKQEEVAHFRHRLVRLISLLYGAALSEVSEMSVNTFEFLDLDDFDTESLEFLRGTHNKCEVVLQWVQRLIVEASDANIIKIAPPILSRVYNQLGNGIVIINNAHKLNDFPMPFPIAQTITFMLLLHWMLTALVVASAVEKGYWAAFISFAVIFAFWSIHYIGMELEQPFGDDPNDLPMKEMQVDMNTSLRDLMHERAREPPGFQYTPEKHEEYRTKVISLDTYITEIRASQTKDFALEQRLAARPRQGRLQGRRLNSADAAAVVVAGTKTSTATKSSIGSSASSVPPRAPSTSQPPEQQSSSVVAPAEPAAGGGAEVAGDSHVDGGSGQGAAHRGGELPKQAGSQDAQGMFELAGPSRSTVI